jgi:uncharacterized protein
MDTPAITCTAFSGTRRIASGALAEVAVAVKATIEAGESAVMFDDATGGPIDLDLRGSSDELRRRLAPPPPVGSEVEPEPAPRRAGRPKLGVVPREVTLLPRHWEWLNEQPGGASVALRRLVDEARRTHAERDRRRWSQEAAYRFMSAMAGDFSGFEEASRALFAGEAARFDALVAAWPRDVREHAGRLAAPAFEPAGGAPSMSKECAVAPL